MKEKESFKRKLDLLCSIPRRPQKISTVELQNRLAQLGYQVSLRSIQRDLIALSTEFPLDADGAKPQGWSWIADAPAMVMPAMGFDSAVGLSMIQSQIRDVLPSAVRAYLDPWVEIARKSIASQPGRRRPPRLSDWFRVLPRSMPFRAPSIRADIHHAVVDGLLSRRQLVLRYRAQSRGTVKEYIAHPLALVVVDVSAYLVCTINEYPEPRMLAMHRILIARPTSDAVRVLDEFNLDRYIAEGHFGVRFSDQLIRLNIRLRKMWADLLVEAPVATDQAVSCDVEGWRAVSATVSDTIQLRRWLHGYGADVEVLAPPALRREFAAAAIATAQLYGAGVGSR